MPRKKTTSGDAQTDVRAAVREWLQARVDLYGHMPGNPYLCKLAALDAGGTISLSGLALSSVGIDAARNSRYQLYPDGSLSDEALERA